MTVVLKKTSRLVRRGGTAAAGRAVLFGASGRAGDLESAGRWSPSSVVALVIAASAGLWALIALLVLRLVQTH